MALAGQMRVPLGVHERNRPKLLHHDYSCDVAYAPVALVGAWSLPSLEMFDPS